MNERTHSWETPKDVAETLLNLDKEDRRKFLREYPPGSTGIGSLMGFTKIEIDDDDPLSIKSLSITSLGIIFALLTILLPTLSILIGRPLSQGSEIIHNHDLKKDGP